MITFLVLIAFVFFMTNVQTDKYKRDSICSP